MISEIFTVVALVMTILSIVWLMIKRDMFEDSNVEIPIQVDFKNLSSLQKVARLRNKLSELRQRDLCPCKSQIELLRSRLLNIKSIQNKAALLYWDEIMQCKKAIAWLEESSKNHNMCDPPKILDVFKPPEDRDVEKAVALTSEPVDLRPRKPAEPSGHQHASTGMDDGTRPSVPVVDKWLHGMMWSTTKYLDAIWDLCEDAVRDLRQTLSTVDVGQMALNVLSYLRRAVSVYVKVDADDDETTVTIDFILPAGMPWDKAPDVVATGPSWRPMRKLCCTPVRFVKPTSDRPATP